MRQEALNMRDGGGIIFRPSIPLQSLPTFFFHFFFFLSASMYFFPGTDVCTAPLLTLLAFWIRRGEQVSECEDIGETSILMLIHSSIGYDIFNTDRGIPLCPRNYYFPSRLCWIDVMIHHDMSPPLEVYVRVTLPRTVSP